MAGVGHVEPRMNVGSGWSPQEVAAARSGPFWYALASNPPCVAWCSRTHGPDDFRVTGLQICAAGFGRGVQVQAVQVADESEPFRVDVYPAEVVLPAVAQVEMTAADARAFADAVRLAADFCETHQ